MQATIESFVHAVSAQQSGKSLILRQSLCLPSTKSLDLLFRQQSPLLSRRHSSSNIGFDPAVPFAASCAYDLYLLIAAGVSLLCVMKLHQFRSVRPLEPISAIATTFWSASLAETNRNVCSWNSTALWRDVARVLQVGTSCVAVG